MVDYKRLLGALAVSFFLAISCFPSVSYARLENADLQAQNEQRQRDKDAENALDKAGQEPTEEKEEDTAVEESKEDTEEESGSEEDEEEDDETQIDTSFQSASAPDGVKSIKKDMFMGILNKKISGGDTIIDTLLPGLEARKNRQDINYAIANGEQTEEVSLFDRFGANIRFPMYLGEESVKTTAVDKIYTLLTSKSQESLSFSNVIDLLFKKDTEISSEYYKDRPDLKDAESDPRVHRYDQIGGVTVMQNIEGSAANYFLATAICIYDVSTFFATNDVIKLLGNVIIDLLSTPQFEEFKGIILSFLTFAVLGFIFYLLKNGLIIIRSGDYSPAKILSKSAVCLISIGLIYALLMNPIPIVTLSTNLIGIVDNIGAEAINFAESDNEIVHSSKNDNVIKAAIWEKAIFDPWVMGTFGGYRYDQLYTTYADKPEGNTWEAQEGAAKKYGDITVLRSSTTGVKNWAALAYSCQSEYHLPATEKLAEDGSIAEEYKYLWPLAKRVGVSTAIYPDDFRWLDAFMKVGQKNPEQTKYYENIDKYWDGRQYKVSLIPYSLRALWLSLLLLPIAAIGFKKLVSFIKLAFNFLVIVVNSFKFVMQPDKDEFSILNTIKSSYAPLITYLWCSLKILVLVILYRNIGTSDNFLFQLLYIALSIYMIGLKPIKASNFVDDFKKAKGSFFSGVDWAKETFTGDVGSSWLPSTTADIDEKLNNSKEALLGKVEGMHKKIIDKDKDSKSERKKRKENFTNAEMMRYTLKADMYLSIEKNDDLKKAFSNLSKQEQFAYSELIHNIKIARKDRDIFDAIEKHRRSNKNKKTDQRLFRSIGINIPIDQQAYYGYSINGDKDNLAYDEKAESDNSKYSSGGDKFNRFAPEEVTKADVEINNELEKTKGIDDPIAKRRALKKLKRRATREHKKRLSGTRMAVFNEITGMSLGKYIPPCTYLWIAVFVLIAYVIGLVLNIFVNFA